MRLVSFVCLRAWTGPDGKGAGFGSTKGGVPPPSEGGAPPPPYSPPSRRTHLGVTHWLAAAPVRTTHASMPARHNTAQRHTQRTVEHGTTRQPTGDCTTPMAAAGGGGGEASATAKHNTNSTTEGNTAPHRTTQHNTSTTAQHNTTPHAIHNDTWHNTRTRDTAPHQGKPPRGGGSEATQRNKIAQPRASQHRTEEHNTRHHSAARHNTKRNAQNGAQHDTARRNAQHQGPQRGGGGGRQNAPRHRTTPRDKQDGQQRTSGLKRRLRSRVGASGLRHRFGSRVGVSGQRVRRAPLSQAASFRALPEWTWRAGWCACAWSCVPCVLLGVPRALPGFAAPSGRCCLAHAHVRGCGRRCASLACLLAPLWCAVPHPVRALSVLLSAFPSPWCLPLPGAALPRSYWAAEHGRCRPAKNRAYGACSWAPAAGALGLLRVIPVWGPAMGLFLAGPSSFGLGRRALRWCCVDPFTHASGFPCRPPGDGRCTGVLLCGRRHLPLRVSGRHARVPCTCVCARVLWPGRVGRQVRLTFPLDVPVAFIAFGAPSGLGLPCLLVFLLRPCFAAFFSCAPFVEAFFCFRLRVPWALATCGWPLPCRVVVSCFRSCCAVVCFA